MSECWSVVGCGGERGAWRWSVGVSALLGAREGGQGGVSECQRVIRALCHSDTPSPEIAAGANVASF